ncbi:transient receptor potential cation channel protein painless-like [Planococcus citri]|uniref:transient receptor potential cation channel protein painless-like n=1 Tax=Planococcus citri TaxID=170843 RepID=UPI0031F7826F
MRNQEKLLSAFKEDRFEDFETLLEYSDIDVDYDYGEPDNGTLLDLVNRSPRSENGQYVSALIRRGAKVWRKNGETGKLEIHEIFNNSDSFLLYDIYVDIMKIAVEENDIEAITLLTRSYSRYRFNDDHPGSRKHLILLEGSIDAVRLFIKYFDVDKEFQRDSQGRLYCCREIILQKYPELDAELPTRTSSELQKILFSYLKNGVPELFVRRIGDPEISSEILNDASQNHSKTYLHVACERNYIDVVDALLKKNVHLNQISCSRFYEFAYSLTPIMLAAVHGHYEVFKKLFVIPKVELPIAGGRRSVLHLVLLGMQCSMNFNCSTDGHRMILQLLLKLHECNDSEKLIIEDYRLNITHTDRFGNSALHYALKFNNEFAIKLLLRAGAKLYPEDQSILTSISATIIEGYFDDCIRSKRASFGGQMHQIPEDEPIIFDYKIFTQLDLYSIATKSNRIFFARFESVTEMRKLYKHPLTKSFLYLKWRFFRIFYYINLTVYLFFCLALSMYIFQTQHCLPSSASFNGSRSTDAANSHRVSSIPCHYDESWLIITYLLYIVLILRELCQFSVSIREYVGIPENWFEMTMIVAIGFLFANDTSKHLAAIAILTSWIELIFLLGKQPSLSIYIEMFKRVSLNFAKFLLLYSILVASFAYSFFILFRNETSNLNTADRTNENSMNLWPDLQMSFFKSIIMMTGEFDASTLPLGSNFSYGHVLFILFVFLVAMVLYNLLNGLAVSDTRAIMEDAEVLVVALISRAKLISQIERLGNKLFGDAVQCIDVTKWVYVFPTVSNRTEYFDLRDSQKNVVKMPAAIVKHAEEILEKRKQSELAKKQSQNSSTDVIKNSSSDRQFVNELNHQFSEQISDLKLVIDAKISAFEEKLLQKWQNDDKRFDQINKLLESVLQEVNPLKNKDKFATW